MRCCFFFFQAEDGIRDLVRSRGLGDVYKRQEFLYVDDMADACVFLMEHEVDDGLFNIGCGADILSLIHI